MQERMLVRNVEEGDCEAVVALERRVWEKVGVGGISREIFRRWVDAHKEGFLVAMAGEVLLGYAYSEIVHFEPEIVATPEWRALVRTGHTTSHHDPAGNTLFGVSIATDPPGTGVGKLLLEKTMELGVATQKKYLITLSRIPGLFGFMNRVRGDATNPHRDDSEEMLARYYALLSMRLVGGAVSPELGTLTIPSTVPPVVERDQVLCRFAYITKMALYEVMQSSFEDPESCNFAALMVHRFATVD